MKVTGIPLSHQYTALILQPAQESIDDSYTWLCSYTAYQKRHIDTAIQLYKRSHTIEDLTALRELRERVIDHAHFMKRDANMLSWIEEGVQHTLTKLEAICSEQQAVALRSQGQDVRDYERTVKNVQQIRDRLLMYVSSAYAFQHENEQLRIKLDTAFTMLFDESEYKPDE